MAIPQTEDALYLAEQRRFRRLEVSLPVWLALEENFDRGGSPWSLGYTRDISMGGSKVFVATAEQAKWQDARERNMLCLLRFDAPNIGNEEYITGRVKHVANDKSSGNIWLGVEYDEGAEEVKGASVRAGLQTVKSRRKWQGALVLTLLVLGLSGLFITRLQAQNQAQKQAINKMNLERKKLGFRLDALAQPSLVGTRAEGIESAFERKDVQQKIKALTANIARLSNDKDIEAKKIEHGNQLANLDVDLGGVTKGAHVSLGVAWPQGYAWSQVTSDLEQLLSRRVNTVVVFKDFKSPFPLADYREAQIRNKTLQITWEPWLNYVQPIPLPQITAGKYDSYIDSWANAAKSLGLGTSVWLRWGHEFNGNWYPWSITANHQNPKAYIDAFRHVHDRFTRAGASNVRWVWCLNAQNVPNVHWNDPLLAYPGDDYVDMISIDGYNFGKALPSSHWQSFAEIFAIPYSKVVNKWPRKALMINEIGCATVGGDKVKWIKDMDQDLRHTFPNFQGLVWFEAQKEADWRMASSLDSLKNCARIFNQDYYRLGI